MLRSLFIIMLVVSSHEYALASNNFKFGSLYHEKGDPESYTLVCLDPHLIPASHKVSHLNKRPEFNSVKDWLRKELLLSIENDEETKKLCVDARNFADNSFYYLVRLYTRPHISSSEYLTTRLWGGTEREIEETAYSASMLIFPQPNSQYVLAYLLGEWSQLLNPYAVIHDWGLRLAATRAIFSDKNIKTMLGKNNFDPNPTTRREKKQRLAPIETFALEIGTEGLQSLTVLPKYAIGTKCQRLVVGSDWYKFFLPTAEEGKGATISSLASMADYLFSVYKGNKIIHSKLRCYLDDEETDAQKINKLNELLITALTSADVELRVFPADNIWKTYGRAPLFSYMKQQRKKNLFKALQNQQLTLDSLVSIKRGRSDTKYEEQLKRIIYSLPMESDDKQFYRFDRGRWFKVASSRFDLIIKKLRSSDIKTNLDALSFYTLEDAQGAKDKGKGLYQEDHYNRRVIVASAGKKQKGVLLDRLNIYFTGAGNQFEFGDMLLYDDKGQYYIVHVKRKEAGDIDHHRAQVERCAEYLATELRKENAADILLQGCINTLYAKYGLSLIQKKKSETHGNYFTEKFENETQGKKTWRNFLNDKILANTRDEAATNVGKLKIILRGIDLNFFEKKENELVLALDALYDCAQKKQLLKKEVEEFLESVKQLIDIKSILFPSGVLTEAIRKKITIVMAVIDDRKIDSIRKAEKDLNEAKTKDKDKLADKLSKLKSADRSSERELFHNQQLWGMDRTVQLVHKYGFKFNLSIINENTDRPDWDAFGSTKDETISGNISDSESDEEGDDEKITASKKSEIQKKPLKAKLSKDTKSTIDAEQAAAELVKKIAEYRYTSTDINRLLHNTLAQDIPEGAVYSRFSSNTNNLINEENADTYDAIHRFNRIYVLPPIIGHMDEHEDKSPYETLLDFIADSFFRNDTIINNSPEELIIPFNPGGHWITLQILIPVNGDITLRYIDSLSGKQMLKGDIRLISAFLRGKCSGRSINFESLCPRIQPDSVSCGAVTVENIKALFKQIALPIRQQISLADILHIKTMHRTYLTTNGKDFDF